MDLTEATLYTGNEVVALMHESTSVSLRAIAAHGKKWEWDGEDFIDFLIETAETLEAQAQVCKIRDMLK